MWSDFPTVYRVVQHYINLWKEYKYRFQSFVDKKQLIEQENKKKEKSDPDEIESNILKREEQQQTAKTKEVHQ